MDGTTRPPGMVFTDLDGTLLDHHTYQFSAAAAALAALREHRVPLVLCSSKTRAEMLRLQVDLEICGPLIVENGGGVFAPEDDPLAGMFPERSKGLCAVRFGTSYAELRVALAELREELGAELQGFGDVDVATVAHWTGLSQDAAARARQREFGEPFLWTPGPGPEQLARAKGLLAARGLSLTQGGRFWHLLGNNDKGRAVSWVLQQAARVWGGGVPSLALGDSDNDLPMLGAAERGVLVGRPGRGHLESAPVEVRREAGVGPVGWNRAVLDWLAELPMT